MMFESKLREIGATSGSVKSFRSATLSDSPLDCALSYAFPLSWKEFSNAAKFEPNDGFIRQWVRRFAGYPIERLWDDYAPIASYAEGLAAEVSAAGVLVERHVDLNAWSHLMQHRRIVTLVAHRADRNNMDYIQFGENFVSVRDCLGAIPMNVDRVLDLTVCNSTRFVALIKSSRPKCTVLVNRNVARLNVRLAMYRQVLMLIKTGQYTFVDAMIRVHESALEVL
jgi:hypothetical protein